MVLIKVMITGDGKRHKNLDDTLVSAEMNEISVLGDNALSNCGREDSMVRILNRVQVGKAPRTVEDEDR